MDILKFFTAGSVDDGKSTLIGRLLYDTNSVLDDQLEAIRRANRKNNDGTLDLAILTDGLKAEREQGITIDVAYKYFQTEERKFIIADTPGHIQYTRNMVTGASNADLAIILIDARKGVVEQTRRHSFIVSLLAIPNVLVCVNKMDMVDYDHSVFDKVKDDYERLTESLNIRQVDYIPVSALKGDNIVNRSANMPWFTGSPLLRFLETIPISQAVETAKARFPVQWVIRPQTDELHDYRGYAGRVIGGSFRVGDPVVAMPSGFGSVIKRIELASDDLNVAENGASVVIHLTDDIDISRGDILVKQGEQPAVSRQFEAEICWMDAKSLDPSQIYLLQHHGKTTKVKVQDVIYRIDMQTLEKSSGSEFGLNDIGKIQFKSADPLAMDPYTANKANGGAILIDSRNNLTVAALMITKLD
ncbi:GTP-binding protein [Parapedobacter sp. ISTM3]|uniref:sulfate adenylyltransferase n=1 Tax=Parapedobacter luteus TaxID=623280 RepID=A0A1T5AZA4_9SPHI|nr:MULTISPECIES: GTP-binding protein [Parapedobacter]MBK1440389.1 GTP-binding protein [Parapedobacter sp. ISTM3]SKB40305.1 sulfate adenylyltransferase subunit 1 [Parapedobacter luteus]